MGVEGDRVESGGGEAGEGLGADGETGKLVGTVGGGLDLAFKVAVVRLECDSSV